MRNFREFEIWKKGIELVKLTYALIKQLPKEEAFGLGDQIRRSVVSIPSNIAEGCSCSTNKDFARYLRIALGSAFELETHFIIARELNMIKPADVDMLLSKVATEQKQINSLITKIRSFEN